MKRLTLIFTLFLVSCASASAATLNITPFATPGPSPYNQPVAVDHPIYGNIILPENDGGPDPTDDLMVYIEALTGYLKYAPLPTGTVGGTGTDNHIARWDGTDDIQDSGWVIDDATNRMSLDNGSTILVRIEQTRFTAKSDSAIIALFFGEYADTQPRFSVTNAGAIGWGPGGATSVDCTLERSAADWLKSTGTGLHIDGPQKIKRTAHGDSDYTILATDYLIALTAISAARTWTLPDATTNAGQVFEIKDESGSITPTNKLTIDTAGGNIDGVATYDITVARGALKVYSNGTHYFVI